MLKKLIIGCLMLMCLVMIACESNKKETELQLYKEVMAVHDECMPKMADLNRLKRHIKDFNNIVPIEQSSLKDSLLNTILILSKSEDGMMEWMEKFKYPNNELSGSEMLAYLKAQKDSVKRVSDDIFMSIAIAKGFLNQAPDSLKARLDIK